MDSIAHLYDQHIRRLSAVDQRRLLELIESRIGREAEATSGERTAPVERTVGSALDVFIGTWTPAEAAELDESLLPLETVDEGLWE